MESGAIIKTIETNSHRITLKGDGIVRAYSKRSHITIASVKSLFDELDRIGGGEKVLLLIDPTEEQKMDRDARKSIKKLGKKYFKGIAVITRKTHVKNIANIMMKLDKTEFPMKLFVATSEAEKWLKELE